MTGNKKNVKKLFIKECVEFYLRKARYIILKGAFMRKSISVFMMIITVISCIFSVTCYASDYGSGDSEKSDYVGSMGDKLCIVEGEIVLINGIPNKLYKTFESQSEAIKQIKKYTPDILLEIADKYNLDELNDSNWMQYEACMYQYQEGSIDLNTSNQIDKLVSFFDMYENYDKNTEIKDLINKYNVDNTEEIAEKLAMLLPYDSTFVKEYFGNMPMARSSLNVDSAIEYAVEHATDYNYLEYGYLGTRDCTNFVSQILEHGGVEQDITDSVYSGWWHKNYGYENEYSRSWTIADTFARYMGVGFTTHDNFDFSVNIQRGDFVSLDVDNDGDWNHMGFVTNVDFLYEDGYHYQENATGKYLDYKIAQHSANYNAWASEEKNHWDEQEGEGARYGRVRR